ncbi:MAG: glutamate-cysteine ligase family protein [Deltaproteobacteria bacterium]|nr:glutamate-cysteine ligase family protein [Deltaproteobacteria bacterium]
MSTQHDDAETPAYHLFDVTGVEVEYMIVDRETFAVRPIADQLIAAVHGEITSEFERGAMAWSNELTLHLIEFKTNGPVASLAGLGRDIAEQVTAANAALAPMKACLLPTAMHPFMDPWKEMKLWPHDYDVVYAAFDRIFDCRGHGWANLQSVHINLPFANDDEFGRLHAAIRVVLPLLPALAASSPFAEGNTTGWADTRLFHYRSNARRVPFVSGTVIPERVFTRAAYEHEILARIYADLAPSDPEGLLAHEWANSRGAIARFDRSAIEIRLLDVQECANADAAIVALVCALVKALATEELSATAAQKQADEDQLAQVLNATMKRGDEALIDNPTLLELLGLATHPQRARDVWLQLRSRLTLTGPDEAMWQGFYDHYAQHGCLSRRLLSAVGANPSPAKLHEVCGRLATALASNTFFSGDLR